MSKAKTLDKSPQESHKIISETVAAIVSNKTMALAAETLGLDRTTLYYRIDKYPEIREAIDSVRDKASLILSKSSEKAAETIVSGLDDEKNKYVMAQDILDRTGIGKKNNPNIQVNVLNNIQKQREEYGL